jgi:hypothetical protein
MVKKLKKIFGRTHTGLKQKIVLAEKKNWKLICVIDSKYPCGFLGKGI